MDLSDGNSRTVHSKHPPAVELKRALAVQMSHRGQSYRDIRDILQVSLGFISASRQRYERSGVAGLRSRYYELLKQAGFSWKKAQPKHPDKDEQLIEEKKRQSSSFWQRIKPRLLVEA